MTSATRATRAAAPKRTVLARLGLLSVVILVCLWLVLAGPGINDGPGNDADEINGGAGEGVRGADRAFTISGTVTGHLVPGDRQPINLSIRNHTPEGLSVTRLTVTVKAVTAPLADVRHPCTVGDFAARQLASTYPLSVDTGATTDLVSLGVPRHLWPRVDMLNTARNQAGCVGATLTLGYSGTSRRGGAS